MRFSDYIKKQGDEFRRAGDGYEALSDTSKACIDYAVQRYIDEYATKQQAISFAEYVSNNEYTLCLTPEGWIRLGESITTVKTSQQLYNQFIEQQNKDNE